MPVFWFRLHEELADLPANFDESSFIFKPSTLLQLSAFPVISASGVSLILHSQIMN